MKSKIAISVIVSLLIGGVLGYFGAYTIFTPEINELSTTISDQTLRISSLENSNNELSEDITLLTTQNEKITSDLSLISSQHETLSSEHTIILENYASVTELYETLIDDYEILETENNNLENSKRSLENNYERSLNYYASLSDDVLGLKETLGEYGILEDSYQRVLCKSEVDKLDSTVTSITDSDSTWNSYDAIYKYVKNNIGYVSDPEIPQIIGYTTVTLDSNQYVSGFTISTRQNHIQTPDFTLENKQGDCDDQAVLMYAMIKNYLINIYGTNYHTTLMRLELGDGEGHLAVLIPVQEGNVCILDSAGSYYTNRYSRVTSKVASTELNAYDDWWSDYGGIQNIVLYNVDITDGDFDIEFEGTVSELVVFLES